MVHSTITQNRRMGAGTAKQKNIAIIKRQFCNCAKEALRITKPKRAHWRWHRKKKNDSIVTRQFCNCTKEALRATLVDATGTVRLSLSVWSECREMRMSGAHYLRVQLLCCCQRESKTNSVAKLFLSLEKITKWNRHRNEKVPTSLMLMQLTSMRAS